MTREWEQKQLTEGGWRRAGAVFARVALVVLAFGTPCSAWAQDGQQDGPVAGGEGEAVSAIRPETSENIAWRATEVPIEDLAPAEPAVPTGAIPTAQPPTAAAPTTPVPTTPASGAFSPGGPHLSTHVKDAPQRVSAATVGKGKTLVRPGDRLPQESRRAPGDVTGAAGQPPAPASGHAPAPASPKPGATPEPAPTSPGTGEPPTADGKPVNQYCINISSAAADARFAWEKKSMEEVAKDIEERIARLEEKTEEYKKWLAKRDEFANKAQLELVNIYSKMKPDAAAAHMGDMNEDLAAALLLKLKPANASAILNEMPPTKGAKLSTILGLAAKAQQGGGKHSEPQSSGGKPPGQPAGGGSTPQEAKRQ